MKVAMLGAGFIGWGGGVDFLKAYIAPLQRLDDCEVYVFIPQDSWIRKIAREVRHRLWTKVLRRPIGRYTTPLTTSELVDVFRSDCVHVVVYDTYWNVLSDLKRALKEHHMDVVFPTILDLGRSFPIPWIPYLPDLQHKYYPEFFSDEEIRDRDISFQQLLRSANSVIVEAQDVKNDLQKFYDVGDTEIFVMPYTAVPEDGWFSLEDVDIDKYHLPEKYFLISNQFWLHKDHKTAFDALKLLHDEGYTDYHIVCTGKMDDYRDSGYFQRLLEGLQKNKMENYVHFLGYIPKRDQIKILCQSQAALQPTLFEGNPGGGIAYNAISLGVPIILSDIPVNLELKSPLAYFFERHSPEGLKDTMVNFIEGNKERLQYSQEELMEQGGARLEQLTCAVHEVFRYNLGGNER